MLVIKKKSKIHLLATLADRDALCDGKGCLLGPPELCEVFLIFIDDNKKGFILVFCVPLLG